MKPLVVAFLIISFCTEAQQLMRKAYFGVGRSSFDVELPTEKYPTWELRGGLLWNKNLTDVISINFGIGGFVKLKRKSYYYYGIYYTGGKGYIDNALDKTTSEIIHLGIDVPVTFDFTVPKVITFEVGGMGRAWNGTDDPNNVLSAQLEAGLLLGLKRQLTKRISVSAQYYYTLTPLWINDLRNEFLQIKFEYALKKRRRLF